MLMLIDFTSSGLAPETAAQPRLKHAQNSAPFVVLLTVSRIKTFDPLVITTFDASPCIFNPLVNSLGKLNKL